MQDPQPELERCLRSIEQQTDDPNAGIFGPESVVWNVNRHAAMFLGSGRAALLQLAHPWVAQAIEDHSYTRSDPYGRFQRTFRRVFAMVYGDLESAMDAARRVHRLHATIQGELSEDAGAWSAGTAYRARFLPALIWVHSTLWDTSILVYETFLGDLSAETKKCYYSDTQRFAALFGIPVSALPQDWTAFTSYNSAQWESEELTVTATSRRLAHDLLRAPDPLFAPLFDRFRILTTGLLPGPIREQFELPFGRLEQLSFDRTVARLRRWLPRLPRRLRYLPPYLDALRRLEGRTSRDPVGNLLHRLYVGKPEAS